MNILALLYALMLMLNKPEMDNSKFSLSLIKSAPIIESPDFAACHASSIVEIDRQRIMSAWFAGSFEGANDVCIWIAVHQNNKWGKPEKVAEGISGDGNPLPCWNPVLFKSHSNKLFLFYKVGKNPREWWGEVISSTDSGKTWSKAQKLPNGFLGPIKNKPIQLKSGDILCPSSTESSIGNIWKIHLEITDESLQKWEKVSIDTTSKFGLIQPSILEHENGSLQMLCRSRENCIVQTWSDTKGKQWGELTKTELPNPNSGIDAVVLYKHGFLLVYNPLASGQEWYNGRNVLYIAHSADGRHWNKVFTLEDEKEGEFSYPAIIQTSDGLIHVTYTTNRKNIQHVVLKIGFKPYQK